jgi:hypothetical protein
MPSASDEVVKVAVPLAAFTVPDPTCVEPSRKFTVPVGPGPGVTVAVSMSPFVMFELELRAVLELDFATTVWIRVTVCGWK